MKEETVLFADSIMRGNQPVTRLLDADYTFVNTDLARHYGMPTLFTGADLKRRLTKPWWTAHAGERGPRPPHPPHEPGVSRQMDSRSVARPNSAAAARQCA